MTLGTETTETRLTATDRHRLRRAVELSLLVPSNGNGTGLTSTDRDRLRRAVELSLLAPPGGGDLPFGAVVTVGGQVVGEARNEVASRCDPTAHAEVLALRAATVQLGRSGLTDAVLYASSEPCPMCLSACYWAGVERVIHAAAIEDAADCGFEDAAYYRQLALPKPQRELRIDAADEQLRAEAVSVLRRWRDA
jgi:tRNA(Arg) A34 adenosine deaminase TadA